MAKWGKNKEAKELAEEKLNKKNEQILEQAESDGEHSASQEQIFDSVEKALDGVEINLGEGEIETEIKTKAESAAARAVKFVNDLLRDTNGLKEEQRDFTAKLSHMSEEDAVKEVQKEIKKVEEVKQKAVAAQEKYKKMSNFQKQHFWNGMHFDF